MTRVDLVAAATRRWRDALVGAAGQSALSDVNLLGEAVVDLTAAHPSGIAQLYAGRLTRLSNLVREGSALASARRHARAVGAAAQDHALRSGLATAYLAIGVATWTESADESAPDAPQVLHAPVLLRPVSISERGRGATEYDLVLEASVEVNPVLAAALRRRGALLDPAVLARGTFTGSGFDPQPAMERLRSLGGAVLPDFVLTDRLLIGTFVHPEQALADDLEAAGQDLADHEVIAALAGDKKATDDLTHTLPPLREGDRGFAQERGVGDLDPGQARVLDALAAGHHLVVDATPGSDVTGTLAAVISDAVAAGRNVLYVAGHRRTAAALSNRLSALGMGDLVLDVAPDPGWRAQVSRRMLGAMTIEPVAVDTEKVEIVDRELLDRRQRLSAYVQALHAEREPWGCSAYDALQALARLTSARPAPRTNVRLSPDVAEALTAERRAQAAADLVTVAGLGAFTASTTTTAWYGADLLTPERAKIAEERVERLLGSVPALQQRSIEVASATGLVPAYGPAAWAEQLVMLAGVRGALDVFQPIAFERSAADMIAATAPRQWRIDHDVQLPAGQRRRLRRQARDLLRPGRAVPDLHEALVDVQHQREVWQAHCPAGGWPQLPKGLSDIEAEQREVANDLAALSAVLPGGVDLAALPWAELLRRLGRLEGDADALIALPERSALLRDLRKRGLGDLLDDLAERQVPAAVVSAELDLTWWSTVYEEIWRQDPQTAAYDGPALSRMVAELRALDRRHLVDRAVMHVASSRDALRERLRRYDDQTQALFAEIVEDRFAGLRAAVERYPDVARHLRPCLVVGPMLVPHVLPPGRGVDLLVVDAAGHLPLERVVGAVARSRQVLVVGDTRTSTGTALEALAEILPTIELPAAAVPRHPSLTCFLAEHGYGTSVVPTPLPDSSGLLALDLVDGTGVPGLDGAIESSRAEVEHVVELVITHALIRPGESLAVVAASPVHAERLREALALVRDDPGLRRFFDPDKSEPFVVVDLGATEGLQRDAVLLSVGFGRTPHGRVLHRFGALAEADGRARLLEALGAVRRRLTVVSCFGAQDLDPRRISAPGVVMLRDLLEMLAAQASEPARSGAEPEGSDRLVLDLAERLWRAGLVVEPHHGVPGGPHIPLAVGHPDVPGRMLVAVLTDDAEYLAEPSLRVRDRQVAERFERLGWSVVHVWSTALFEDPQAVADVVTAAVLDAAAEHLRRNPSVPQVLANPVDGLSGDRRVEPETAQDAVQGILDVPDPVAEMTEDQAEVEWSSNGRPEIPVGRPISEYSDDQLDELVAWLRRDGVDYDAEDLAAAVRSELGVSRRGSRIDAVVGAAVRRALSDG